MLRFSWKCVWAVHVHYLFCLIDFGFAYATPCDFMSVPQWRPRLVDDVLSMSLFSVAGVVVVVVMHYVNTPQLLKHCHCQKYIRFWHIICDVGADSRDVIIHMSSRKLFSNSHTDRNLSRYKERWRHQRTWQFTHLTLCEELFTHQNNPNSRSDFKCPW